MSQFFKSYLDLTCMRCLLPYILMIMALAVFAPRANDNLPNLVKCALGLTPTTNGHCGRINSGQTMDSSRKYLTFTLRDSVPMSESNKRFMRLKITQS